VKKLNTVFEFASLQPLEDLNMHFVITSQIVGSIHPESETLITRHKEILEKIKHALLGFPIGKPTFDIESQDQLELQLSQLKSLVELVKRLFDEREQHIEEMASLIQSQHRAVLRMSECADDSQVRSNSAISFQRSKSILDSDRSSQRFMSRATLPSIDM
jgi:hypothetical protein